MKLASALSLALFLGSMTLLAQSSARNSTQSAVAHPVPASTNCPVEMHAQRRLGQGTPYFRDGRHQEPSQKLRLTLTNSKFTEIVGIRITVHGLTSKGLMSLAQAAKTESSEIKKTIDLKLKVGPQADASTDVLLPAFTSVRLIDLDSVSYAGGSTWRSYALHTCHIVPDGAMLISSL